jgi:dTDP-4-dehydrorhamnose reductase
MKILLLGNTGQLGWELNRTMLTLGDLVALDYPQINVAEPESISEIVRTIKPTLILNATAYTDVEKAESDPGIATAINSIGPGILAEEARKINAALIHYSTDYVFDGNKGEYYNEKDEPDPLSVYGSTKLAGEKAVQEVDGSYLILRTSWVYSLRRPCFVTKVLQWARKNEVLRIVDDQTSSPTWARTLAEATAQIIAQSMGNPFDYIEDRKGLYHLSDDGYCSRFEWAKVILELDQNRHEQIVKEILPAQSSDFLSPVKRPVFSPLNCSKIKEVFSVDNPNWKVALKCAFHE